MGQFDQTARPLSKMDGGAFFDWALGCAAPGTRLSFVRWDDTRRLVRFALVDGSIVRRAAGPVYLALDEPAPDVHMDVASCAA